MRIKNFFGRIFVKKYMSIYFWMIVSPQTGVLDKQKSPCLRGLCRIFENRLYFEKLRFLYLLGHIFCILADHGTWILRYVTMFSHHRLLTPLNFTDYLPLSLIFNCHVL